MICAIRCSRNDKVIAETLVSRGISLSDDADISIIERGLPVPEKGIIILFDPDDLNSFIDFLDALIGSKAREDIHVIPVKSDDAYEILRPENIIYFTATGNNVYCHTESDRFEVKKKLYELERDLRHRGFVRVNKSTVVNILKVSEIAPWFGGRLLLIFKNRDKDIEVSRSYVSSFKDFLGL